jgi:hypothetical protein
MKKSLQAILLILWSVIKSATVFGQSLDPTGPVTNLCPSVTYRYESPAQTSGGVACDYPSGWACEGCINPNDGTETVIGYGVYPDGKKWADVKWNNVSSGRIGNFCGILTVSIISTSQPKIAGPSTVLLCGTSSITIQATVTSTTNIIGYVWNVEGTGISPTGSIATTVPQLTVNYSNWIAGSSLSATVAVGAKSSCGFITPVTPLTTLNPLPGVSIPAIPRSAWVQLSPGNINNLMTPLNFTNTIICSSGTVSVTNQPSGSNLTWTSSNTSRVTINSITGLATRQNNYNGFAEITANLSNACGSFTHLTNLYLGLPSAPGPVSGETSPSVGGIYTYISSSPSQGAVSHNWTLPFGGNPIWSQNNGNINGTINTLAPSLLVGSSSGWLQAYGINVCGNSSPSRLRVFPVGGGGGGQQQRIAFPNPTNEMVNVKLKEDDNEEEAVVTLINKNLEKVLSKTTKEKEVTLLLNGIPEGNLLFKHNNW